MFLIEDEDENVGIFTSITKAKEALELYCKENNIENGTYIIHQPKTNVIHFWDSNDTDYIWKRVMKLEITDGEFYWWKSEDSTSDPITEFAYAVLSGDPQACDAVRDILKI